jgi:hypothetical protein
VVDGIAWVSPKISGTFASIASTGITSTSDPNAVALALLVLDHESQHQKLYSRDEGRVNACALNDIPRLLSTKFNVEETTQGTVLTATSTRVRVRYRVRVRVKVSGHWVYRYRYRYRFKYVTKTTDVPTVQTVPNPVYGRARGGSQHLHSAATALQHGHLLLGTEENTKRGFAPVRTRFEREKR